MKLLLDAAIKLNLSHLYKELEEWNNRQSDKPLLDFNDNWLNENKFLEADYLFSVGVRISKELSIKHALIIFKVLSDYGNIYAKLVLNENNL
jgi:hypothetical protein